MATRGRPPHPDILTPREWEVFELVREGLNNPAIAERLGITRAAVKFHVSEILGKLAAASREEASAWDPRERPDWSPRWDLSRRPAWATALVPFTFLWRRSRDVASSSASTLAVGASALLVGLVVAGLALLAVLLLRNDGGSDSPPSLAGQTTPGPVSLPLRPDQQRIYTVNADGSGLRELFAEGDFLDYGVAPDGRHAAVSSFAGNDSTVYLLDLDDGSRETIAEGAGYTIESWSADGEWLALAVYDADTSIYSLALYSRETGAVTPFEIDGPRVAGWAPEGDALYVAPSYGTGTLHRIALPSLAIEPLFPDTTFNDAALSPDGEWLALGAADSPTTPPPDGASAGYTIEVVRVDGSDKRQLVHLPEAFVVSGLTWSPDGERISYAWNQLIRNADGSGSLNSGVYSVDVASGQTARLTQADSGVEFYGEWSQDGQRLLVNRGVCTQCDGPGSKIVLAAADGSGEQLLPGMDAFRFTDAAWSPEGDRFAFSADKLYVANADGSDVRAVAELAGASYLSIEWSADGQRLFFQRSPTLAATAYAVSADGSDLEALTAPAEATTSAVAIAPDGTSFAWFGVENRLFVQEAGSPARELAPDAFGGFAPGQLSGTAPVWSPDGSRLAVPAGEKGGEGLAVVTRDGAFWYRDDVLTDGPVRWSPDSTRLAYASDGGVWTIDAAGGEPVRVADSADSSPLDWSPDGTEVAFIDGSGAIGAARVDDGGTRTLFAAGQDQPDMLRWSPDGTQIAIRRYGRVQVGNLADGTVQERGVLPNIGGIEWTADSASVVFYARGANDSGAVYVLDTAGGEPAAIIQPVGRAYDVIGRLADGRILVLSSFTL